MVNLGGDGRGRRKRDLFYKRIRKLRVVSCIKATAAMWTRMGMMLYRVTRQAVLEETKRN